MEPSQRALCDPAPSRRPSGRVRARPEKLALALPPSRGRMAFTAGGPLRGWRRRRLVDHALVAHPGEEQNFGAAVTRSHATGTVRGPERNDIVHGGPRVRESAIVAIRPQCRRAKVNKW